MSRRMMMQGKWGEEDLAFVQTFDITSWEIEPTLTDDIIVDYIGCNTNGNLSGIEFSFNDKNGDMFAYRGAYPYLYFTMLGAATTNWSGAMINDGITSFNRHFGNLKLTVYNNDGILISPSVSCSKIKGMTIHSISVGCGTYANTFACAFERIVARTSSKVLLDISSKKIGNKVYLKDAVSGVSKEIENRYEGYYTDNVILYNGTVD